MNPGWVRAPFTTKKFIQPWRLEEVIAWIHTNTRGEYRIFGQEFWFKDRQDLTVFLLRWA